jgi:hypothetical protein
VSPTRTWDVSLKVRAQESLLPLAVTCAEKTAIALGLGEQEALAITLASEEIFGHLCRVAAAGRDVEIRCRSGGYYVEQEFVFKAQDFNMRAFNLTASASVEDDSAVEETGLLIACRMVDRFKLAHSEEGLTLTLIKEKAYPEISEIRAPEIPPLEHYIIRAPDPEELKVFVHLVNRYYEDYAIPGIFRYPGKLVDMVASDDYGAAVAVDGAGRMGGGVLWQGVSAETVEWLGPYLFNQSASSGMALDLVDACIEAVARSRAESLITRFPTRELPADYFELLGSVTLCPKDGHPVELDAFYRHLGEDLGSAAWCHPLLEEFLVREYERLAFARQIHLVQDEGETHSPFSVLSAELDRSIGSMTLRPVWWGKDASETVASHVSVLLKEDVSCILFEIDVGRAWHSHFVPALLDHGFEPRFVLPLAGKGDVVVFQHSLNEPLP